MKDRLYMMHKKTIGFGSYVYGELKGLTFGYSDYENAMHYYNHFFHCWVEQEVFASRIDDVTRIVYSHY
jgi:hypothetical protein